MSRTEYGIRQQTAEPDGILLANAAATDCNNDLDTDLEEEEISSHSLLGFTDFTYTYAACTRLLDDGTDLINSYINL